MPEDIKRDKDRLSKGALEEELHPCEVSPIENTLATLNNRQFLLVAVEIKSDPWV